MRTPKAAGPPGGVGAARLVGAAAMAMEQYDDDEAAGERVLSNTQVLGFLGRFWLRRWGLLAVTLLLPLIAIGVELMMPPASRALIDTVTKGPGHAGEAWKAWGVFVGVYL